MKKKILKNKNIYVPIGYNRDIESNHKFSLTKHTLSKDKKELYDSLSLIYQQLDKDFCQVDVIDFNVYERWLNG